MTTNTKHTLHFSLITSEHSPHSFHFCYCFPVKSFFPEQQEDVKLSQLGRLIYTGLRAKNTLLGQIFLLGVKKEKKQEKSQSKIIFQTISPTESSKKRSLSLLLKGVFIP